MNIIIIIIVTIIIIILNNYQSLIIVLIMDRGFLRRQACRLHGQPETDLSGFLAVFAPVKGGWARGPDQLASKDS